MACSYVTEYESHSREGEKQASLYYKITAVSWVNTAIITAFITPFADTLEDETEALIPAMMAIFVTEMFKAPVVQYLDIPGHFKRHVLGPRAADQKRMNIHFKGTDWLLSERYTVSIIAWWFILRREKRLTRFASLAFLGHDKRLISYVLLCISFSCWILLCCGYACCALLG